MDYKSTVRLPRTEFSMKADLVRREPEIRARWDALDVEGRLRAARKGAPRFVLHDGPPYANGDVHIGTALNKVLKDLVVRHRNMAGFDAPFVPGWDCHGLPIEHRVLKEAGPDARSLPPAEVRARCRVYAEKYLDIQRAQFRRLGCAGLWDRPYLTMDPSYEDGVLSVFGDLVREGRVTRDQRSTTWCPSCTTALAEAELEYRPRQSPSVFVRFRDGGGLADRFGLAGRDVALLAWTTTPWTLPANLALAVHPDLEYVAVERDGPAGSPVYDVMARGLVERVAARCGFAAKSVSAPVRGRDLVGQRYVPLFREAGGLPKPSVEATDACWTVVAAAYVSAEDGTGCVHTAPGHGADDFETGRTAGLPPFSPLDDRGRYVAAAGRGLEGLAVPGDANPRVIELLRACGALVAEQRIEHSYAHCWRCKGPILYRCTDQWFVRMDRDDLRTRCLEVVEREVRWFPAWGARRIGGMLRDRPDWCISRQRSWGIPIPALRCTSCLRVFTHEALVARTRDIVRVEGTDAWYAGPAERFSAGERCPHCGCAELALAHDIFDVWFESGSSWRAVVQAREELEGRFPSDLVLEGTDQHRGWFQLSLIPAVALTGGAPWCAVLTHGFIVDTGGEKVSKSRGGLLNADEIADTVGVDVARLWIASVDAREDVPVSKEILVRAGDAYRSVRNTFRWLLGNLAGFDAARDAVDPASAPEEDLWILHRLDATAAEAAAAFEVYEFSRAVRAIREFMDRDLSAFHFDFSKDRFYCASATSPALRAGRTALFLIAVRLARLLAPVLVHTCDEIWGHLRVLDPSLEESVHLASYPGAADPVLPGGMPADLRERFEALQRLRERLLPVLEGLRAGKTIGSAQEALVEVLDDRGAERSVRADFERAGADLCRRALMVSDIVAVDASAGGGDALRVTRSPHGKCVRCWNLRPSVGASPDHPALCDRCTAVVTAAT